MVAHDGSWCSMAAGEEPGAVGLALRLQAFAWRLLSAQQVQHRGDRWRLGYATYGAAGYSSTAAGGRPLGVCAVELQGRDLGMQGGRATA